MERVDTTVSTKKRSHSPKKNNSGFTALENEMFEKINIMTNTNLTDPRLKSKSKSKSAAKKKYNAKNQTFNLHSKGSPYLQNNFKIRESGGDKGRSLREQAIRRGLSFTINKGARKMNFSRTDGFKKAKGSLGLGVSLDMGLGWKDRVKSSQCEGGEGSSDDDYTNFLGVLGTG